MFINIDCNGNESMSSSQDENCNKLYSCKLSIYFLPSLDTKVVCM